MTERCRDRSCARPVVRAGYCARHALLTRAAAIVLPSAVPCATFTYPGTGTVHATEGDWTRCGAAWVAGFRDQHPHWSELYDPAGSVADVTCRNCRRALEEAS